MRIAIPILTMAGAVALSVAAWNPMQASASSSQNNQSQDRPWFKTRSYEEATKAGAEIGVFGGGCFWCTERDYRRVKGVLSTDVGYMGGHVENPTYEIVCSKKSGHVEVTRVEYDPNKINYREILVKFFQMHDPTQVNRQGPDVGEQYQSVIFVYNDDQQKIAEEVRAEVQKKLGRKKVATTIRKAETYWRAEEYHQQYYEKKGW